MSIMKPNNMSDREIFNIPLIFGEHISEPIGRICKSNPAYVWQLIKENRKENSGDTLFIKLLEYIFFKSDQRMPFGIYQGKSMRKIQDKAPSYFNLLKRQLLNSPETRDGWLCAKIRYLKVEFSMNGSEASAPEEIDDESDDVFD